MKTTYYAQYKYVSQDGFSNGWENISRTSILSTARRRLENAKKGDKKHPVRYGKLQYRIWYVNEGVVK